MIRDAVRVFERIANNFPVLVLVFLLLGVPRRRSLGPRRDKCAEPILLQRIHRTRR
jgi:hypothetical protein